MKISIVIPCHNAEETIGEQLESISKQQCDFLWEVVVVNNCCTDKSMQVVESCKSKIKNLTTVEALEKKNTAYARNTGVDHADAELIAFCDADDKVGENWLPSVVNALEKYDFIACKRNWKKLNNFSDTVLQTKVQREGLIDFSMGKCFQHGGGGSLGIKKSIHYEAGGFDELFHPIEDLEYCWRVQFHGHKLTFIPEAVIYSRARDNDYKIFKQELKWAEQDVYVYKKYEACGLPDFSFKKSLRSLYHVLRASRWLFSREKKGIWVRRTALQLGRIKGIIKYRLFKYKQIKPVHQRELQSS